MDIIILVISETKHLFEAVYKLFIHPIFLNIYPHPFPIPLLWYIIIINLFHPPLPIISYVCVCMFVCVCECMFVWVYV